MRNVESHLLEDKMDEAVTHYINSQPPEAVHVDANSLALNIQDDGGGRVVTLMHSQNFQSQMCRQISVGEQVGEGPWVEDLLDPEGRLAVLMAHLTQNPRTSHHQSHPHHKITTVRSDVDGTVILDTPYGQSLESAPDSIAVQVSSLPPLPPLQDMKRCSDADWFDKDKTELKNNNAMLDETGGVLELCAATQRHSKKSLPHKKRISKKLKRHGGSTPQQDIVVINCAEEGPHEEILPDSFAAPPPHQMRPLLICQLCGEFYGCEQLKFYHHLKQHYEPHTTIIIENPVPDLAMDKMTNTCIVDNVATLPDSIVELSLENTVPKTLYQDKHILYNDKSLGYSKYSMMEKELEAEKAELYSEELEKLGLYSCVKCNKSFRKQKHCEAHIKEAHSNANPKLEDMGEFSETEDLMEGIHVAVDDAEQYEQALLPHLVVDNGHVHQEHVRAWYMRNGANGTPVGPLCECGGVGYCEACTPHVAHTQTHAHAHMHMTNPQVTHMSSHVAHVPASHTQVAHGHGTSHASTHAQVSHVPVTSHAPISSHVPSSHAPVSSHASVSAHVLTSHVPVSSHMQSVHVPVSSQVPAPSHVPASLHVPVSSHVPVTSHGPATSHMPGSSHIPVSAHVPVTSHPPVSTHVHVTTHVPASPHSSAIAPSLVTSQRSIVLKEEVLQGIFDAEVQNTDNGFAEGVIDGPDVERVEHADKERAVGGARTTVGGTRASGGGATAPGVGGKKTKRYECGYCSRVFEHRNSLLYHVLMHSGRQQTCRDCGKSFYTATALKIHKRVHSGYRPCKCDECGRDFKQWSDLKYHKASIHSNQKNFKCEFCDKEFARRYSLSIHRRIHTGERNYKCDYCAKTFRASSYRLSHMRTHTGNKPHKCTQCDKRFRVAYDLRRHLKIHDKMFNKLDETKNKSKENIKDKKASLIVVETAQEKTDEKAIAEKDPKTTRLPVLKSILDKKQPKTSKRVPKKAPNVTVQSKDGQFKIAEYSDEFVKQEQYLNDVYEYKEESALKKVNYAEERSRSHERTDERELATLRPMFRNQIIEVESDRLVFNRESTDGKMQVFTQVEKKEYTGPIVSNAMSLSDIRSIDREVSRGSKGDLHSEAMESGFFERLTSLYNIPAV